MAILIIIKVKEETFSRILGGSTENAALVLLETERQAGELQPRELESSQPGAEAARFSPKHSSHWITVLSPPSSLHKARLHQTSSEGSSEGRNAQHQNAQALLEGSSKGNRDVGLEKCLLMGPGGAWSGTKALQSFSLSLSGLKGQHCFVLSFRSLFLWALFLREKAFPDLRPSLPTTQPDSNQPDSLHWGFLRFLIQGEARTSTVGKVLPFPGPPQGGSRNHLWTLPRSTSGRSCRWRPRPSSCWRQKEGQSQAGKLHPWEPESSQPGAEAASHWIMVLKGTAPRPTCQSPPLKCEPSSIKLQVREEDRNCESWTPNIFRIWESLRFLC